ncbi:uridine kinase family protein [Actinophytocola oryzae]|uniref:AAA domain-containing protein n=1 Tax=Actinophytocola oryzae TaxID=502181 RepID=A0A4R7VNI5_9PSEU|nr:AAA family ATPase [Actinophytocola oryzae]TDV51102.1 AAA domain-containing protein [Actinophytocola oryzae]
MSVAARILAAPPRLGDIRLVAVDGPSGSGKSTFADRLLAELPDAVLVRTDDFATWDDPVSWWPRLVDGVLTPLSLGRPGGYRRTEWPEGRPRPGEWVSVGVPRVLLVEGVSAGRRSVRARLSCLVWCEVTDPVERLARAVARDGDGCRQPLLTWQKFESGWFTVDGTREAANYAV